MYLLNVEIIIWNRVYAGQETATLFFRKASKIGQSIENVEQDRNTTHVWGLYFTTMCVHVRWFMS